MTPERAAKFQRVVDNRQFDLTVILENVHDAHNIGAVLRSCDSIGIREIYVLYSEPGLDMEHIKLGKRTSAGSRKWVDVNLYTEVDACFEAIKKNYDQVWATHLGESAKDLYELDLTQSIALLFGNEHDGVSEEALKYCDGNFVIPQVGMVESLNISVACAVTLYEAFRQRKEKGWYEAGNPVFQSQRAALLEEYHFRHERYLTREIVAKKNQ